MISLKHIDEGISFDFSKISDDYAKYRDVYPDLFFEKIIAHGLCTAGQTVLDLGTGTGVLPRHLVKYGAKFVGADISANQIANARALSEGLNIEYIVSSAEEVSFPDATFDTVMACMCFTYFNKPTLLPRIAKMLKDGGRFAIMSLVWLPGDSEIAQGSENIILRYNPTWNGVGYKRPTFDNRGIPTTYDIDLSLGFKLDSAFAFDVSIAFTRENWHGRMRATRGLATSALGSEQIAAFERDHLAFLAGQPASFDVPHSATFCILKKAS
jgi:cyclopropane fatty-acyl-phospholipid synthase-like methyltransferase